MKLPIEDFDAVLDHWCVVGYRSPKDDCGVIIGMITADQKGRFPNGGWIMTSMLISPLDAVGEPMTVQTLNTRYLLRRRFGVAGGGPRPRP